MPTATPINIFSDFAAAEVAATLQNTKPGKTLVPDSIRPKLIIHAQAALKVVT